MRVTLVNGITDPEHDKTIVVAHSPVRSNNDSWPCCYVVQGQVPDYNVPWLALCERRASTPLVPKDRVIICPNRISRPYASKGSYLLQLNLLLILTPIVLGRLPMIPSGSWAELMASYWARSSVTFLI